MLRYSSPRRPRTLTPTLESFEAKIAPGGFGQVDVDISAEITKITQTVDQSNTAALLQTAAATAAKGGEAEVSQSAAQLQTNSANVSADV